MENSRATYSQAKLINERIKVDKQTLILQDAKDEVLDRQHALSHIYQLLQQARRSWPDWPVLVAPSLASELSVDPSRVVDLLTAGVAEHLRELGEIAVRVD